MEVPTASSTGTGGTTFQVSAMNVFSAPAIPVPQTPVDAEGGNGEAMMGYGYGGYANAGYGNGYANGYGNAGGYETQVVQAAARDETVVSQLNATYEWTIPDFVNITEDKIVSLPFGGHDWKWQLVLYPRGSTDSEHTHLSCFLRPLRNLDEIDAGDLWRRGILSFQIRIMRGTSSGGSGSYADTFSGYGNQDETGLKEILVEDTSASSFTGFDSSYPGWGFTYLLDLARINEAISPSGSLTISAVVSADIQTNWTTSSYPWTLHNFDINAFSQGEFISPTFGPPESQWCIVLSKVDNSLSGHLQPVLSNDERYLGTCWRRSVSSLTLKVRSAEQPQSSYGGPSPVQYAVTKTLTGGFTFKLDSMSTGWPNLIDVDKLDTVIDSMGSVVIEGEVTWDPNSLEREWGRGTRTFLVTKGKEASGFEQQIAEERRIAASAVERGREVAEGLRKELEVARTADARVHRLETVLKGVRASMAGMVARIEDGTAGEGLPDAERLDDEDAVKLRARLYAAEADLARAREELKFGGGVGGGLGLDTNFSAETRAAHRKMSMASPVGDTGDSDRLPVGDAIVNLKNEVASARMALEDVSLRNLNGAGGRGEADRAAVRADLAMVVAELEVARAALSESLAAVSVTEVEASVVSALREEVTDVVVGLEKVRAQIVFDSFCFEDPSRVLVPPSLGAVSAPEMHSIASPVMQVENALAPPPANTMGGPLAGPPPPMNGFVQRKSGNVKGGGHSPALAALQVSPPLALDGGFALGAAAASAARAEPWTPADGTGKGLDSVVLEQILHKLDRIPKRGAGFLSLLFALLLTISSAFLVYSAVHVHCASDNPSPICSSVVPAYHAITGGIHVAAEGFVRDIMPKIVKVGGGVLNQSVKVGQGAMKKVQKGMKKKRVPLTVTVTDVRVNTVTQEITSTALVTTTTTSVSTSLVEVVTTTTAVVPASEPTGFAAAVPVDAGAPPPHVGHEVPPPHVGIEDVPPPVAAVPPPVLPEDLYATASEAVVETVTTTEAPPAEPSEAKYSWSDGYGAVPHAAVPPPVVPVAAESIVEDGGVAADATTTAEVAPTAAPEASSSPADGPYSSSVTTTTSSSTTAAVKSTKSRRPWFGKAKENPSSVPPPESVVTDSVPIPPAPPAEIVSVAEEVVSSVPVVNAAETPVETVVPTETVAEVSVSVMPAVDEPHIPTYEPPALTDVPLETFEVPVASATTEVTPPPLESAEVPPVAVGVESVAGPTPTGESDVPPPVVLFGDEFEPTSVVSVESERPAPITVVDPPRPTDFEGADRDGGVPVRDEL
ncbi:hypothetical protein HDU97_002111 [Phlyctochytrium planicorne]|nr:hypothetical protein HDU97_002111 [Phlyctochytrium planicorne]